MATKKAATRKVTKASATPAKRPTTVEKKTAGAASRGMAKADTSKQKNAVVGKMVAQTQPKDYKGKVALQAKRLGEERKKTWANMPEYTRKRMDSVARDAKFDVEDVRRKNRVAELSTAGANRDKLAQKTGKQNRNAVAKMYADNDVREIRNARNRAIDEMYVDEYKHRQNNIRKGLATDEVRSEKIRQNLRPYPDDLKKGLSYNKAQEEKFRAKRKK